MAHNPLDIGKMAIAPLFAASLLLTGAAHGFQVGDLYYSTPDENNCVSVTGSALESPVNVVIPESVAYPRTEWQYDNNGNRQLVTNFVPCNVTGIANLAFFRKGTLRTVSFPDCLFRIGGGAFAECTSLGAVSFPRCLGVIDDAARYDYRVWGVFYNCTSLTNVAFNGCSPIIGERAFELCSSLMKIDLPEGLKNVPDYAFDWCEALSSVTIPDGVTNIGWYAFYFCTNLTSVVIPDSVTSIWHSAFGEDYRLSAVSIGSGVRFMGSYVFENCYDLTTLTIFPGVTTIGDSAFSACTNLSSVTIPNSVTNIGNWAFYKCNFSSVAIPNGVRRIGEGAFSFLSKLTSLTIPQNVERMSLNSATGCKKLKSIFLLGDTEIAWPSPNYMGDPWGSSNQLADIPDFTLYVTERWTDGKNWDHPVKVIGGGAMKALLVEGDVHEDLAAWVADLFPAAGTTTKDIAEILATQAANNRPVWECYVAGISPTNETQVFRTVISWEDGEPRIGWEPELPPEEAAKRVYTEIGKTNLADTGWTEVSPANCDGMRFFKVNVEMK